MSEGNTGGYWGWITAAQTQAKELAAKAQEFAEVATKVAQEKATVLAQKADELRQNYDMEVATSILMNTVGGQVDPSFPRENRSVKTTKMNFNELDLVYVTENLVAMAFPFDRSKTNEKDAGNDIDVVSAYLKKKHADHYMVWNVSEESYDYSKFGDQVLEYKFPGHPAPPLGLLFKICTSVESWLDADESNIAVVHCLTGKGRTAALMACVLTWIGEFTSPMEALQYIADRRGISVEHLTIPSQRRYVQYFSNMLDGVRPRSEPLLLRRVIINSIPIFGTHDGTELTQGCCPYLQLFKNGKLIATATPTNEGDEASKASAAAAAASGRDPKMQLRWINASEGSVSFTLDCAIQGDILLRCRHAAASGTRVSMFRAGFHTGYVPSGVLRLTKAQLDGCADPRYDDSFFIDLIFAPIVRAAPGAAEIPVNSSASVPSSSSSSANEEAGGAEGVLHGTSSHAVTDQGLVIDATSTDKYELSLHKDVRFWETIATRKTRSKRRKSRKFLSSQQEQFSIGDDVKGSGAGGAAAGTETEVDFLAASAAAAMSKPGSSASSVTGLSDSDLIMQLAQLEGGGDASDLVSPAGSCSVSDQGVDSDDFTLIGRSSTGRSAAAPTSTLSTPAAAAAASVVSTQRAASELQALEELEKELGLDDMQLFSTNKTSGVGSTNTSTSHSTSVTPAPKSTQQTPAKKVADDDNMDELEQYLLSLSSPSAN